jgi:hypothetical protein
MIKHFYLSKQSIISGPYSEEDIVALQNSGQLQSYGWIWDSYKKDWQVLDPKPLQIPQMAVQPSSGGGAYALLGKNYVRTQIQNVTPLGYEVLCSEAWMNPPVGIGMTVQILNPDQNQGLDRMKIQNIQRVGSDWVLFLRH